MLLPQNLQPKAFRTRLRTAIGMLRRRFGCHGAPTFFIVGAQKAGTTSLAALFEKDVRIGQGIWKELRFFNLDYHHQKGKSYYESLFPFHENACAYFDATPEYLYYPVCAERISQLYPNAKIIIMLRDPVKRAYSAWNMYRDFYQGGKVPTLLSQPKSVEQHALNQLFLRGEVVPFDDAIDLELQYIREGIQTLEPGLIRRGFYANQVQRFYDTFGEENVLVTFLEEIINDPVTNIQAVYDFLEIGEPPAGLMIPKGNARKYPECMSEESAARLASIYSDEDMKLEQLLGRKLPWRS
jgi:hypothetical protein